MRALLVLVAIAGCGPSAREADCKKLEPHLGVPQRTWSYAAPADLRAMKWQDPEIAKVVAEMTQPSNETMIVSGDGARYEAIGSNTLVVTPGPTARLIALCSH